MLLAELLLVVGAWAIGPDVAQAITAPIPPPSDISNTQALGLVLYTRYVYFFQAAGLILLVAMIGAIVLTLQHKPNVRRQNIAEQVARTAATAIDIVKVEIGAGGCHDHRARPLSRRLRRSCSRSAFSASFSTARTSSSS